MVGLMEIFSTEQLLKLENHQYHCQGLSVIEAILDPYWKRFVTKLPRWLSPNALTLTGLLSIIIPSSLLVYYSYQGITECTPLLSVFCSFGFIMWMNMDCMDGKLARQNRTRHSPFGELLDHGGDAVALLIVSIALSCQIGLQNIPCGMLAWVLVNTATNYIQEPWTIYLSGAMQVASLDFVEAMLSMATISMVTGIWGVAVWQKVIFEYFNLKSWHLVFGIQMLIAPDIVLTKVPIYYRMKKNGMRLDVILEPGIPCFTVVLCACTTYYFSTPEFLQENIILILLCFGLTMVKLHVQLMVIQMLKEKFNPWNYCLTLPVVLAFGVYRFDSPAMEKILLFVVLILVAVDTSVYLFCLYYQLYNAFDERIFVMRRGVQEKKSQNGANQPQNGANQPHNGVNQPQNRVNQPQNRVLKS